MIRKYKKNKYNAIRVKFNECVKLFYIFFWCFTSVKHLGTCYLSGLWLLAEPSDRNSSRPGQNS